jgi:Cell division protein anillin
MVSSGENTYEKPYSRMGDQEATISTIRSHPGDDGYDTVDYMCVAQRYENYYFPSDATHRIDSSPESTPTNSNNSSGSGASPSQKYRSWTNKLRNSFRKSRKYLRYEQNRLANLFEDKQKSKAAANDQKIVASASLEEYKKIYDDKRADNLYETLNKTLQQSGYKALAAEEVAKVAQINLQRSNKKQLLNARKICQSRPQFECSEELIEAERLLLLSDLNEAAAKRELIRIDNIKREQRAPPPSANTNSGTITFNDFEFPLKDEAAFDAIYKYYYVCAFTYKNQVRMTRAKAPNEGRVYFRKNEIRFKDVEPQFEIKMEVYALRLRMPVRNYSHESKFNLNKVSSKNKNGLEANLLNFFPTFSDHSLSTEFAEEVVPTVSEQVAIDRQKSAEPPRRQRIFQLQVSRLCDPHRLQSHPRPPQSRDLPHGRRQRIALRLDRQLSPAVEKVRRPLCPPRRRLQALQTQLGDLQFVAERRFHDGHPQRNRLREERNVRIPECGRGANRRDRLEPAMVPH